MWASFAYLQMVPSFLFYKNEVQPIMRSSVYAKDYSADRNVQTQPGELKEEAEFIRDYSEFMQVLPKKVSVKKKTQYEHLLNQCDWLAANEKGKIRAVIDEEKAEAWIEIILSFLEFTCEAEFHLLSDICTAAEYIKIDATEEGTICFMIRLPYFDTCISEKSLDRFFNLSEEKN